MIAIRFKALILHPVQTRCVLDHRHISILNQNLSYLMHWHVVVQLELEDKLMVSVQLVLLCLSEDQTLGLYLSLYGAW